MKINPNFSHGYNNLGVSYQHINDIDSAMQSYEKSAKLNPKYPGPLYNIANVFFEKKKAERAIEYYQKTIELSPNFLDAFNNMGNCYLSLGKYDESIDCFNKILKINGLLALEIGNGQFDKVSKILKEKNFKIEHIIKDFGKNIRGVISILKK